MSPIKIEADGFYTSDQLSKILDVHIETIRRKIKKKILPAQRVGHNYMIKGQFVIDWMSGNEK